MPRKPRLGVRASTEPLTEVSGEPFGTHRLELASLDASTEPLTEVSGEMLRRSECLPLPMRFNGAAHRSERRGEIGAAAALLKQRASTEPLTEVSGEVVQQGSHILRNLQLQRSRSPK